MNTLKIGDTVPAFSSLDDQGNNVQLSDYQGKKLIVFLYPKANTPGCTAEASDLRDSYKVFSDKGFSILGVSADGVAKQANFKNKYSFR